MSDDPKIKNNQQPIIRVYLLAFVLQLRDGWVSVLKNSRSKEVVWHPIALVLPQLTYFHNSGFWSGLSVRISFTNENGWFMKTESWQKGLPNLTPFLVCNLILESMKATVDMKRGKKNRFQQLSTIPLSIRIQKVLHWYISRVKSKPQIFLANVEKWFELLMLCLEKWRMLLFTEVDLRK